MVSFQYQLWNETHCTPLYTHINQSGISLDPIQVHCMLKAAAIFLDSWYTYKFPEGLRDVMNFKLLLWQKRFCSTQLQLHLISHTHFLSIQCHQA